MFQIVLFRMLLIAFISDCLYLSVSPGSFFKVTTIKVYLSWIPLDTIFFQVHNKDEVDKQSAKVFILRHLLTSSFLIFTLAHHLSTADHHGHPLFLPSYSHL